MTQKAIAKTKAQHRPVFWLYKWYEENDLSSTKSGWILVFKTRTKKALSAKLQEYKELFIDEKFLVDKKYFELANDKRMAIKTIFDGKEIKWEEVNLKRQ